MKKKSISKIILLAVIISAIVLVIPVLFPHKIEKSVIVNQQTFMVELYEDGSLVKSYPMTAGKLTSLTKVGEFKAIGKAKNIDGLYNLKFPYWIGVYTVRGFENGIHSIEGENKWADCIGNSNCTPGSIILNPDDMEKLYEWIEVGTPIEITTI